MLRLLSILWLVLTIILIGIPLGFIIFYVIKKALKSSKLFVQKIDELKALDNMRKELLQKRVQENEEDKIWNEFEDKEKKVEDENLSSEENSENNVVDIDPYTQRQMEIKKKKLIEKIHYEALILKKDGKLDLYEKKVIEGLAMDPDNIEFNQMLADLYFTMGNYNKALSLLKKLIEIDPDNHNAIWQLGEIYLIKGDFETAELLVEKAIAMKSSNPKYYISMVEILYNTDRKKEAVNIMEKIVRLRPTNSNYIFTLATLYEELGHVDEAKKYYFRVLECEPSNEKAKKKLKSLT